MKSRNLKIESTGDYFAGKVKPQIRLKGHWLDHAGFRPGHHVAVYVIWPGLLALRFLEETTLAIPWPHAISNDAVQVPVKNEMPEIRRAVAAPLAISHDFVS
jgi:Toxin SymE, type I toxin-antitoxin system